MESPPTVLHALVHQASSLGDRPALWTRRHGSFVPLSWRQYAQRVQQFALGLRRLGFGAKEALGIFSFNREEWLVANLAAMAVGGVPVGLYANLSGAQLAEILGHAEVTVLVVEDGRALTQVLALRAQLPRLRSIIVMHPPERLPDGAVGFEEVLHSGREATAAKFVRELEALQPDGLASLIYTSGTTGSPKGVMLSHRNLAWTAGQLAQTLPLGPQDMVLSYLPLSHIAEQHVSIYLPLVVGMQVSFAESVERMPRDLESVRPTLFLGVPRVWEKMKAKLELALSELPPSRRAVVDRARRRTSERHERALSGGRVSTALELEYQLASRTVFQTIKRTMGLDRTQVFVTAAAPIGMEVLTFFASLDMVLREIYGQSEVAGPTTVNTLQATRLGSLGRPMLGVEVRIAADGEVLVRGENVCQGYFKDAAATAELLADGWLHSGDLGELDGEGFLKLTGRKKDILVTSGGKKTSPANIEALLRTVVPVGHAVVAGEGKNYLVALLSLDPEAARALAVRNGWPVGPSALSSHPRFLAYLEAEIAREVNAKLSRFETVKRFAVLPEELSIERGELTPTLKVKRGAVLARHQARVDALYEGASSRPAGEPAP